MKAKWLDLTMGQRILLCLQGFLILLFLLLYCTLGRQQVVWYQNSPLRIQTDGAVTTYSGKVDGMRASFTVSPGPVVAFRCGDREFGPYSIVFDPTAVPSKENALNVSNPSTMVGVAVLDNGNTLFRGAYVDVGSTFLLLREDGDLYPMVKITVGNSESVAAPSVSGILRMALAPEVVRRGSFGAYFLGLFLCVVCAVSILFADALFRFHLRFRIRDPEDAEPSDWELAGRWISWLVLSILAFVCFVIGLNVP